MAFGNTSYLLLLLHWRTWESGFCSIFQVYAGFLETDLVLVQGSYKRFADSLGAFLYNKLIKDSLSKFYSVQDESNEVMSLFKPKHLI
jgi:hypothetical protein